MSFPAIMKPHMVENVVPRACCSPDSAGQFEDAPGKLPIAESVLLDGRCSSGRSLALNVQREPLKEALSHFGWKDEQRSTQVVKSKASSRSRTSPARFVLHSTVNSWKVPTVVPFPRGQGAEFCLRCIVALSLANNSRGNIIGLDLPASVWMMAVWR